MKKAKVQELDYGLYRIFYKKKHGGGFSLASVGGTYDGTRWYAPCNWTTKSNSKPMVASTDWSHVKKVEKIND